MANRPLVRLATSGTVPGAIGRIVLSALLLFGLLVGGCASLPKEVERTPTFVVSDTSDTRLGRSITPIVETSPALSGFFALTEGTDAFVARVALIKSAEKSLDVQYYIWHDDLTGKVLYEQLLEAADRGVRVRLLLDDLDTAGKDDMLNIIDSHPNIEIRLFNPFANRSSRVLDFVGDTRRINHRMHNKSLTADNQATIFGGRNIGDEYFDAAEAVGFSDMDVVAVGPIVNEVSDMFDLYWNCEWVYPLAAFRKGAPVGAAQVDAFRQDSAAFIEAARSSEYANALRRLDIFSIADVGEFDYSWGKWTLIYDQPSKVEAKEVSIETHLAPRLLERIDATRQDLTIVSPYFVPGPKFTAHLGELVGKGVRVRIMTNSLAANDVPLVHAGYMRYRKELIRSGVELYEFKPVKGLAEDTRKTKAKWSGSSRASLHGKFLGFDQRYMFVGSFNLDGRSIALNTEMGAYFESPRYAELLSYGFDHNAMVKGYRVLLTSEGQLQWVTLEHGKEVSLNVEPETGFWKRFGTGFMSVFVPESQL